MDLPEDIVKVEWRERPPDRAPELQLLTMLATHAQRESSLLAGYRKLAAQSDNPGVRCLAHHILEHDTAKHIEILRFVAAHTSQRRSRAHASGDDGLGAV
jgi:hypothetical protein